MYIHMYPFVANYSCTKLSLQGFPRIIQHPKKRMMMNQHKYPQHPQQNSKKNLSVITFEMFCLQ